MGLTFTGSPVEERAIRRHERSLVAQLARAHIDDGDLLALQRFLKAHGDKAAQRGLALFVGYLANLDQEPAEAAA